MKNLSIILACFLVALMSCTKSKEVHPELGDGNEEFITVAATTAHVEYTRTDIAELRKVVFHYSLSGSQPFVAAEMAKKEDFLDLTLNDLVSDTLYQYYYELFPSNGESSITEQKTFHTLAVDSPVPPTPPTPPSGAPEGAINGLFTINANGDQVYFSQGNLQYQASTNTWRFAEHQFDQLVTPEELTSWNEEHQTAAADVSDHYTSTYDGWIDLFGWGTSGWHDVNDPNNLYYQPWSTFSGILACESNIRGYGPSSNMPSPSLTGSSANYDWGVFNPISNGGNLSRQWRTMTIDEWDYVFYRRNTNSGFHFAPACVNGVGGVIILPDDWNCTDFLLYNLDGEGVWGNNVIDPDTWVDSLQIKGAVFLPANGVRSGTWVEYVGSSGCYWQVLHSGPSTSTEEAVRVGDDVIVGGMWGWMYRCSGASVRLVQDAKP